MVGYLYEVERLFLHRRSHAAVLSEHARLLMATGAAFGRVAGATLRLCTSTIWAGRSYRTLARLRALRSDLIDPPSPCTTDVCSSVCTVRISGGFGRHLRHLALGPLEHTAWKRISSATIGSVYAPALHRRCALGFALSPARSPARSGQARSPRYGDAHGNGRGFQPWRQGRDTGPGACAKGRSASGTRMHPQRIEQFASANDFRAARQARAPTPPPHSRDLLRIVAGQRVDVHQRALARLADLAEMRLHARRDAVAA